MRKVLVFTSLFPNKIKPDSGIFIKRRMLAYAKRNNCEIRVVAPVPYFPKIRGLKKYAHFSKIPQREIIDDVIVYHPRYPLIPKMSMPVHGKLIYYAVKGLIRKIYREFRFDVIDGHFIFPDCQAATQLGESFKVPVIVSARGSDIHQYIYFSLIRPQIIKTLKKSTKIISVCQALKDLMVGLGIKQNKISVIPNGVDTGLFYPLDKKSSKEKLGFGANTKMILSVGSLISLKGHDLTINAVSHLVKKNYNVQFCIIGNGIKRQELERLIKELDLTDNVSLIGHVPNDKLTLWYNAADVFCLSSAREGWANVLTESLACGTPVVATNVFGALEIVKDDSTGILVKRTVGDITDGLITALNRQWNQGKISQETCERTWDVVAEEVDSILNAAVGDFKFE